MDFSQSTRVEAKRQTTRYAFNTDSLIRTPYVPVFVILFGSVELREWSRCGIGGKCSFDYKVASSDRYMDRAIFRVDGESGIQCLAA
jgi:hypothetical protein